MFSIEFGTHTATIGIGSCSRKDTTIFRRQIYGFERWTRICVPRVSQSRLRLRDQYQQSGLEVAVGMTQLFFDGAFMGASVGLESAYLGSFNLD